MLILSKYKINLFIYYKIYIDMGKICFHDSLGAIEGTRIGSRGDLAQNCSGGISTLHTTSDSTNDLSFNVKTADSGPSVKIFFNKFVYYLPFIFSEFKCLKTRETIDTCQEYGW